MTIIQELQKTKEELLELLVLLILKPTKRNILKAKSIAEEVLDINKQIEREKELS